MPTLRHLPAALAAVLALAATTTACGGDGAVHGTRPGPVLDGSWAVQRLTADGKTLTAPPAAQLEFAPSADHRTEATGNYGCNGFTAAVTREKGTGPAVMTVTPGSSTTMACADMPFETAFARLFRGRLTVDAPTADQLALKTPDGSSLTMTRVPRTPDAPLTATEWTVESLISGESVSSLPAEAAGQAGFSLAADGTASGRLGCNRFSAPAGVDGPKVTFGPLTTTRMACLGPAGEVERELTGLFGSGPLTWKVQARTLTLTAPDGTGLTARAASAAE
ncbi:META domain-containing protein [Streptomyces sp. NPDC044571]|uniref:META domain-containing protein n=1 Tax=Streptomyces sp. NPDC044571 TaxID=3155371 RepID=UPI0033F9721F